MIDLKDLFQVIFNMRKKEMESSQKVPSQPPRQRLRSGISFFFFPPPSKEKKNWCCRDNTASFMSRTFTLSAEGMLIETCRIKTNTNRAVCLQGENGKAVVEVRRRHSSLQCLRYVTHYFSKLLLLDLCRMEAVPC